MDENGVDAISRHRRKSPIEIRDGEHRNALDLNAKLLAGGFSGLQGRTPRGAVGVQSTPNLVACGTVSFNICIRLSGELGLHDRQSRNVPARPRQACDMSEPNGVGMRREDDRDRVGCPPGAFGLGRRGSQK